MNFGPQPPIVGDVVTRSIDFWLRNGAGRAIGLLGVLLLLGGALFAGCGSGEDPLPPPFQPGPSGPPGVIEAVVRDSGDRPVPRTEVRLLRRHDPGTVANPNDTEGGGGALVDLSLPARAAVEGPEMQTVQTAETDGFGKFRFADVPPGDYLLSAGRPQTGISRQWIKLEPGQTLNPTVKLPPRR